ncbi:MAG: lipocalin family protein [Tannerellaceae bacterium]
MKKHLALLTFTVATACTIPPSSPVGAWVQPIPGMENQQQGIRLKKGGEAESINMATLKFDKWLVRNDSLLLSGESIGNGQSFAFTEAYKIATLTADSLVLEQGSYQQIYKKQK